MKLFATSALFALMTMIVVPSTPVMAAIYTCSVTGSLEYFTNLSTLTSGQKSYALSRIKSSYLAVHQDNYPGYTVPGTPSATSWTIKTLPSTTLYWNEWTGKVTTETANAEPQQEQQEAQLRGSVGVEQTNKWYGSFIKALMGIRCVICNGSVGDDDTIPPLTLTLDEGALEHLSVQTNINRWEAAWCDELTQNPAYPMFLRARNCQLVFSLSSCKATADDGEADEDLMEIVTVTINDNDVEETLDTLDVGAAADMVAIVA